MKRRFRRALGISVLIIFATIIAGGFAFELIGERQDRRNLPQVGRSFGIGGRSLNLYCSGTGSPTVLFESNAGIPGYRWVRIQHEVANFTRACWYDRAGLGWSDPGPFPNHSDSIAHDLHDLLTAAKVVPPYILVGDAMGGFHVRVYRSFYPAEVAGLVLIDPMNEDMTIRIHNHNELFRPSVIFILRATTAIGLSRLLSGSPGPPQHGWTQQQWTTFVGLLRERNARLAVAQELPMWVNGELARAGSCYGDLPITVLSAGIQDQEEDPKLDHDHAWKLELHERLARLSTRGQHVVIPESGHDISDEAPEAVIQAIRNILQQTQAPPPNSQR